MTARIRRIGWVLLMGLVLAAPEWVASVANAASGSSLFTVTGIKADASAATAVAAKESARVQGLRAGFQRLLERLTAPADAGRLPHPDDETLNALLQDFEVAGERSSSVRYLATYTLRFNPAGVRRLLQEAGIGFTELASKPVVVVPVLAEGGQQRVWDDPNPWKDAWNTLPGRYGLVPWVVPAGDLTDVTTLDAANAGAPPAPALASLSQHYGGGDVVVAVATVKPGVGLAITATRYPGDGAPVTVGTEVAGEKIDAALYQSAVLATQRELEGAWKQLVLNPPAVAPAEAAGPLDVDVPFTKPADWGAVRDRLERVPTVRIAQILMLTHDFVRLRLNLLGDRALVRIALAQQDLVLDADQQPAVLKRRGGPAPEPEAAPAPTPDADTSSPVTGPAAGPSAP